MSASGRRAISLVVAITTGLFTTTTVGASTRLPPFTGSVSTLDAATRQLMVGRSWHAGCPVPLRDLRLLRLTYYGFDGRAHQGELVVHRWYTNGLLRVFRRLYDERYPIRRMRLVDRYGADDDRSMEADNTSAFNCRLRST